MDDLTDDSFESSDDDIYTNAVARFKAAKRRELKSRKKNQESLNGDETPIELLDNEDCTLNEPTNLKDKTTVNESIAVDESSSDSTGTSNGIEIHDTCDSKSNSEDDRMSDSDSDLEITGVTIENPTKSNCVIIDDNDTISMEAETSKTDLDFENYTIEVKFLWRSHKLVHLEMQMYEPFENAFKHFEKLENVPIKQILLLRNEKPIKPDDTPASLGISVIDIIEGGVIDMEYSKKQSAGSDEVDENVCKIKVQMSQKQSIVVNLQKDQPFKIVFHQCEAQFKVPVAKIKLFFDGELINLNDTPESLDLEDEACIDLKVAS